MLDKAPLSESVEPVLIGGEAFFSSVVFSVHTKSGECPPPVFWGLLGLTE